MGGFEDAASLFREFWRQLNEQHLDFARKNNIINQNAYIKLRSMLNGFEYTLYNTESNISQSEMFFDIGALSSNEENPNDNIVQLVQNIFTGEDLKVTHVPDAYMLVYFNLPREKPFNMSKTITLTKPEHAEPQGDIPHLP